MAKKSRNLPREVSLEVHNGNEVKYDRETIENYDRIQRRCILQSLIFREPDLRTSTKNLNKPFTKMDPESLLSEFFAPTTINGEFDFEDLLPSDSLIEESVPIVPDLYQWSLDEPDVTEENLLDEIIPSPEDQSNPLDSSTELDKLFFENYIDLTAFEACANPEDFTVTMDKDPLEETMVEINYTSDGLVRFDKNDSVALVPEITDEMCESLLTSSDEPQIDDDDFVANIPDTELLDIKLLEQSTLSLLETFESSFAENLYTTTTSLQEAPTRELSIEDNFEPVIKKSKLEVMPSGQETCNVFPHDKVVARRIKNNAASRVCRASRRAKHHSLFEQEKTLIVENKELTSKVEELSKLVEYLRQHLIEKLSAKHTSS